MGIDNFHKWLRTKYENCYEIVKKDIKYDHVYIDMNYTLHSTVYGVKDIDSLFEKIAFFLNNALAKIVPTKSITFATDGPAAYAKLVLQRKRRLKMIRSENFNVGLDDNLINPIYFTPGTKFMKEFNTKLETYYNELELKYNITVNKLFDGPDEAEVKLFKQLMINNEKNKLSTHLIISNDADVIVMATSNPCHNNISIGIKQQKNNVLDIFNINKFINELKSKITYVPKHINIDFSTIILMMGNDYIPKLNFVNFDRLWNTYNDTVNILQYGLCDKGIPDIVFLKKFMSSLILNIPNTWIKRFSVFDYNEKIYDNYIAGLMWCIKVYTTGKCVKYDYMYNYNVSPHPLGLMYYLELYNTDLKYPIENLKSIPDDIYAILVLPKKARNLIDKKYHHVINNKLNFLFEEEVCEYCNNAYLKISNMHKTAKYMADIEEDNTDQKSKITIMTKELSKHRKKHKDITVDEINYVINCLSSITA
jgi:5'-3' exonuclease